MTKNQNEEAVGEVGAVYTTRAGMQEADPYEQSSGWRQVTPTKREQVISEDAGTHLRWMVWRCHADATRKP